MDVATLSAVKQARHAKILDAAEDLFLKQGLRATTMEGVAAAVGMSKVTVYAYFKDKDILFGAVADRFALRMEEIVHKAFAGSGSARDKVEAALLGKHELVSATVRSSRFASDIFQAKNRTSRLRFRALDGWTEELIAEAIGDPATARLLLHASQGIANGTATWAEAEEDIKSLVHGMLPGKQ